MDRIKKLINKYREIIMYLIMGAGTTLVNFICYTFLVKMCHVSLEKSNAVAWFVAVLFAYITNKIWVFETDFSNMKEVLREIVLFFSARIATGFIEIFGFPLLLYLGIRQELFGIEGFVAKILIAVIVVVLNYVFSKFLIFRQESKGKINKKEERG